jgi:MiaB/RimO family radical SAM methylthiotransferase
MKNVFLASAGTCLPAQADLGLLKAYLFKNGWILTDKIKCARTIIIYTCAFNREKEDFSIELIKNIDNTRDKDACMIITGCLPAINRFRLKAVFNGPVVSADSLQELDGLLKPRYGIRDIAYAGAPSCTKKNSCAEYPLRIGWGCYGSCAYCAIKFVFGRARSRTVKDIIGEFELAYRRGYRRFVLVANDAGVYGMDQKTSLKHLLKKICQEHKDCQFAISHISPNVIKKILPSLGKFVRSGKIWRINIPVDSGSDRLLKLMRRPYNVATFKRCIKRLISYNPKLRIETDFLVGFPSETQKDFSGSLRLAAWLANYNVNAQCLAYSNRPKAESSKMPKQVKIQTKKKRLRNIINFFRLNRLLEDKRFVRKLKRRTTVV